MRTSTASVPVRSAWRWRVLSLALVAVLAAASGAAGQVSASPRFRLAIVGLTHGHSFIAFRTLTGNTNVEVVGISDADAELRAQAATIWPDVPLFENHEAMLDAVRPDGVWSFVDNHHHVEVTRLSAARGISVMFEKPMATTYADAVAIRDIARERGIQVVINSQPPWWPANHTAEELVRKGTLGTVWRVHTVSGHGGPGGAATSASSPAAAAGSASQPRRTAGSRAFWSMLNSTERGGGVLLDFGPYGAAWVRWYLGMPSTVYATQGHTRTDTYHVPTTTTILASYPDHRVGVIEASWDLPRNIQQVEIFGDKGSVDLVSNSGSQLVRFESWVGRERQDVPLATPASHWSDPATYFAHAVRRGHVDEFVSAKFHADVMAILEAAQQSVATGRPVAVSIITGR